jgi:hypothetical protein
MVVIMITRYLYISCYAHNSHKPKGAGGPAENLGTLRNEKEIFMYEILPPLLETWKRMGLNPQEELLKALMRAWAKLREP